MRTIEAGELRGTFMAHLGMENALYPFMAEALPITCKNCGTVTKPIRRNQLFCSPKCNRDYFWRTHRIIEIDEVLPAPDARTYRRDAITLVHS